MTSPTTPTKKPFLKRKPVLIIGSTLFIVIVLFLIFKRKTTQYQFITVKEGNIVETVTVTGSTTPMSSVELGFGNSGKINSVYSAVGKSVSKGQILARLDTSDLNAQLSQAEANLSLQKAQGINSTTNIDEVKRQQDILVNNAYRTLLSANLVAIPENVQTTAVAPTISGTYNGEEGEYIIHMYPSSSLSGEAFYLSGLENGFYQEAAANPVPLGSKGLYIEFPTGSLSNYGDSVWRISIPNKLSPSYAINENNYKLALANRAKAISDAESSISGSSQGLSINQAQIASAEAGVQAINARIQNSKIIAPISGVVTEFNAKVGQFTSAGTPLVSIISKNNFEVDAIVSEIDIGKIGLDNKVSMTLDAFPGEKFEGTIFYIDPAQTSNGGAVGYKIKVSFDNNDERMKSGLTANLNIETRSKDNVLILPQYAILENDEGTFVQILKEDKVENIPVKLGLQDQDGNVEIISGVTSGEQVLNIGLKK